MAYERDPNYPPQPTRIPIPGMQTSIGFGDVVANITHALGIKQCEPCKRRQQWLNERLRIGGRR